MRLGLMFRSAVSIVAGRFRFLFDLLHLLLAFLHQLIVFDHLADHLLGSFLCFLPEFAHDEPPVI